MILPSGNLLDVQGMMCWGRKQRQTSASDISPAAIMTQGNFLLSLHTTSGILIFTEAMLKGTKHFKGSTSCKGWPERYLEQ